MGRVQAIVSEKDSAMMKRKENVKEQRETYLYREKATSKIMQHALFERDTPNLFR